jgi:hypothetical protein
MNKILNPSKKNDNTRQLNDSYVFLNMVRIRTHSQRTPMETPNPINVSEKEISEWGPGGMLVPGQVGEGDARDE